MEQITFLPKRKGILMDDNLRTVIAVIDSENIFESIVKAITNELNVKVCDELKIIEIKENTDNLSFEIEIEIIGMYIRVYKLILYQSLEY